MDFRNELSMNVVVTIALVFRERSLIISQDVFSVLHRNKSGRFTKLLRKKMVQKVAKKGVRCTSRVV